MASALELGAMFPFLPEGRELPRKYGVGLEDLVTSHGFQPARLRGLARLETALEGQILQETVSSGARETDLLEDVLSYLYARIVASAVNDQYLTKKLAVAEGKRFIDRLERLDREGRRPGDRNRSGPSVPEAVRRVLEGLGIVFEDADDGNVHLHFSEYLTMASNLDQKLYGLAIQSMKRGTVTIPTPRFYRLAEERFRARVLAELPMPLPEQLYQAVQADAEKVAKRVAEHRAKYETGGVLDESSFPPCISHLLEMTGKAENVPHMGRFTLVAFLHTIGYDKEGMVALFSRWPDFNVEKSMYQIQHIIGETSGTEYSPPLCSTMKTYGICYNPDQLCASIRHPLSYYRRKLRATGKLRTPAPNEASPDETASNPEEV